jgi:hypothetical protein
MIGMVLRTAAVLSLALAAARKMADGTVQTPRVTYGKNGLVPPM